jgi:hypothetical protein
MRQHRLFHPDDLVLIQARYRYACNTVAVMDIIMEVMVVPVISMRMAVRYTGGMQRCMRSIVQMGMAVGRMTFDAGLTTAANGTHRTKSFSDGW